jgi:hypothetical protein
VVAQRRCEKATSIRVRIQGTTQGRPIHALMLWMVAAGSFVIGVVARVFAANNDLWFDEVWTLQLIGERVHSFGDVFTNLKHSNNHHLCSLWMWFVGQNASALVYRLPSVLASIGTVVLAGLIGARRSWMDGCVAVILTSWSYLLIHFGTEARGYSLAIFFAFLAWYALQRFAERRSWIWIIIFWSATVLGFLAHLEFAVCFAGVVVWSFWRFTRNGRQLRDAVLDLLALFVVPIALMLAFYLVAIRGMEVASGPTYRLLPLLIKTASYTLGGPGSGALAAVIALCAVAALFVALIYSKFDRDDRRVFYAVVILAPAAVIAIQQPEQFYVRYLMISVAIFLLLLSSAYASTLRQGLAGPAIGVALLSLYVIGNSVNTINLLRFGRGQYLAALHFIEAQSQDRGVVITSDHDFRNGMLVNYYKRYLAQPDFIQYANGSTLNEHGANWLLLHRFEFTGWPDQVIDVYRNTYKLVRVFRYSDLSGWNWLLYQNVNPPAVPAHRLPSR